MRVPDVDLAVKRAGCQALAIRTPSNCQDIMTVLQRFHTPFATVAATGQSDHLLDNSGQLSKPLQIDERFRLTRRMQAYSLPRL